MIQCHCSRPDGFNSEVAILSIHSKDINEIEKYVIDNEHISESTAYSDFISDNEVVEFACQHDIGLNLIQSYIFIFHSKISYQIDSKYEFPHTHST